MKQKLIQLEQDNEEFFACGACGGQGTNPETVVHMDSCVRNGYTKGDFMVDKNEFGTFIVCVNCGSQTKKGNPVYHHNGCKPGQSAMWAEHYEKANELEEHMPFTTIYLAIAGWKAQLMVWNDEEPELGGFWEPAQVSHFAYSTPEEAERYAKDWANAEDVEYVKPSNKKESNNNV
jgi:hypothetical protein